MRPSKLLLLAALAAGPAWSSETSPALRQLAADATTAPDRQLATLTTAEDFAHRAAAMPHDAARDALLRETLFATAPDAGCALIADEPAAALWQGPDALWPILCGLRGDTPEVTQLQVAARAEGETDATVKDLLRLAALAGTSAKAASPATMTVLSIRLAGLDPVIALDPGKAADPLARRAASAVLAERGDAAAIAWLADHGAIDGPRFLELANGSKAAALAPYARLSQPAEPAASLKTINDIVSAGGTPALTGPRGALLKDLALRLPASTETAWAATSVAPLLLAQGERAAAGRWIDLVAGLHLEQAQPWQLKLYPLALIAGLDSAGAETLPQWARDVANAPEPQRLPLGDILSLLEARGIVIDKASWAVAANALATPSAAPSDPAKLQAMQVAAQAARQNDVVLAAVALAPDFAAAPIPTQAAIIRALAQSGLERAADAVAIEALLALLYPSA